MKMCKENALKLGQIKPEIEMSRQKEVKTIESATDSPNEAESITKDVSSNAIA